MSKELPYFRFYVSEWLNDDISLEDELTKGVFIDVCSFYWFRDCSITKAMLKKRFSNNQPQIESLINSGIIKQKDESEYIEISFLDKQFDELSELRKRRQEAGRKGGKQSLSKPKAKLKQTSSYKDKIRIDKDKIRIDKDNKRDFPFVSEQWLSLFTEWINYKKARNENYKTQQSLEACYRNLLTLSNNDISKGRLIIDQAMGNNWQGLFPLRVDPKQSASDPKMSTKYIRNGKI